MKSQFELKHKKAVIFIGLRHHAGKMVVVGNTLEQEGMQVIYLTSASLPSLGGGNRECFELFLMKNKIPYRHLYEYRTPARTRQIARETEQLQKSAAQLLKLDDNRPLGLFGPGALNAALRQAQESRELFAEMLEVEKPDIVLGLHEANFWVKLMAQAANTKGIPVLTFQEGFYTISEARGEKYAIMAQYSTAALWGEEAREAILHYDPSAAPRLIPVGNPEYDFFFNLTPNEIRQQAQQVRGSMGIASDTKICILFMPNPFERYRQAIPLEELAVYIAALKDTLFLVKWHPRESRKTIESFYPLEQKGKVKHIISGDIKNLLPACDVCMVLDSSAGLDAVIYGKPLLEINTGKTQFGRSYADDGVALRIADANQFSLIAEVLAGKRTTYRAEDREHYLSRMFYKTDGKSSQRIIELIKNLLRSTGEAQPEDNPIVM